MSKIECEKLMDRRVGKNESGYSRQNSDCNCWRRARSVRGGGNHRDWVGSGRFVVAARTFTVFLLTFGVHRPATRGGLPLSDQAGPAN